MKQKIISAVLRVLRFIREVILFCVGLVVFGVLTAGTGDGLNPNKVFPFIMLIGAIITAFILSYVIPRFLRKKWPEETGALEERIKNPHTSFLRIAWILLAMAIIMGLSITLVSRSW